MIIDTFSKIGYIHSECQDYILSGIDPIPYIILADGCSSAKNSDIGARLLCYAAQDIMSNRVFDIFKSPYEMGVAIVNSAYTTLDSSFPSLAIDCLDATLVIAYLDKGFLNVIMYGDGCIYIDLHDSGSFVQTVSYDPNTPAYLRYLLHGKSQYDKLNSICTITSSNTAEPIKRQPFEYYMLQMPADIVKSLMISSDGVESFVFKEEMLYKTLYINTLQRNPRPVSSFIPPEKTISAGTVMYDFSEFKIANGQFLSRRVKKVLKEYLKSGFVNEDDLSIGCFHEVSI